MPLYIVEHPSALLNMKQKEQICKEITRIDCAITGSMPTFVNVIFHPTDNNVEFVNNKLRHKTLILGHIRAGRSTETKESLINQIDEAWTTIVGKRCHFIGLADIDPENIAEDGIIMPAVGKEFEWLAKNLPIFEQRAQRGKETSQDLLADINTIQSKL